jgi:hypothetical protein
MLVPMASHRAPLLLASASLLAAALVTEPAHAAPPPPDLLARLATYAAAFEAARDDGGYILDGRLEKLDGDGKVDSVQELSARVEGGLRHRHVTVLRAVEDGKDKTAEVQKKAQEGDAEAAKGKNEPHLRMPFLASEQPRYDFELAETDPANPSRIRVTFVPKEPAKDTVEGSAWIDGASGHVLTAGFKLSKPGTFIDYVHITAEFADSAPVLARVTFDGKGGLLFFRKHFRGETRFHDYQR